MGKKKKKNKPRQRPTARPVATSTSNFSKETLVSVILITETSDDDGVYTVNFSTSLPDSNYAVSGFACNNDNNNTEGHMVTQNLGDTYSTSALKIRITELTSGGGVSRDDVTKIAVMVVR